VRHGSTCGDSGKNCLAGRGGLQYGFFTDIENEQAPLGLNEGTVRFISAKKREPQWLLEWRLQAFQDWQKMEQPDWAKLLIAPINYQAATYYSAPKQKAAPKSLDEVDPELLRTYEKLGIPLQEQQRFQGIAVDAVFDSVSVATTFKAQLAKLGIIFGSFGEAVREHPELVRKYLGSVVPQNDNFFAALNSAVFSDGSFAFIPPGGAEAPRHWSRRQRRLAMEWWGPGSRWDTGEI
jgi:Fe-S cluster assembly protein SufB